MLEAESSSSDTDSSDDDSDSDTDSDTDSDDDSGSDASEDGKVHGAPAITGDEGNTASAEEVNDSMSKAFVRTRLLSILTDGT